MTSAERRALLEAIRHLRTTPLPGLDGASDVVAMSNRVTVLEALYKLAGRGHEYRLDRGLYSGLNASAPGP